MEFSGSYRHVQYSDIYLSSYCKETIIARHELDVHEETCLSIAELMDIKHFQICINKHHFYLSFF